MYQWTEKEPTKEGWYWKKSKKWGADNSDSFNTGSPTIDYVRNYAGKMCITNWEIPSDYLWAGPIKEPSGESGWEEEYYK